MFLLNNKNIEQKRQQILNAIDKKMKSINIKQHLNYAKYAGPGWHKKIKRLLFAPQIVIKNKLNIFLKRRDIDFVNFNNNHDLLLNFIYNLNSLIELITMRFFVKTVSSNDVFYDIGAEKCLYTSLGIEFCKEIHSFEPLPEFFDILEKRFSKYPNVYLNNIALADKTGTRMFCKAPTTLIDDVKKFYKKVSEEIEVFTTTLDEYISHHQKPTFIKMDVEGAEHLILKGGEKFFKNNSPIIVMEILGAEFLSNSLKALDLLKEYGFKPFEILLDGEIKEIKYEDFLSAMDIYNYVFLK
jgi:FkbM family methyltransferase